MWRMCDVSHTFTVRKPHILVHAAQTLWTVIHVQYNSKCLTYEINGFRSEHTVKQTTQTVGKSFLF